MLKGVEEKYVSFYDFTRFFFLFQETFGSINRNFFFDPTKVQRLSKNGTRVSKKYRAYNIFFLISFLIIPRDFDFW